MDWLWLPDDCFGRIRAFTLETAQLEPEKCKDVLLSIYMILIANHHDHDDLESVLKENLYLRATDEA